MPQEDRPVQVAIGFVTAPGTTVSSSAVPIEMGGMGDVVELLGVHYSLSTINNPSFMALGLGISSNPEHELAPPVTILALLQDTSLYAVKTHLFALTTSGAEFATHHILETEIIPLYGIIRPRRQIFVFLYVGTATIFSVRAELYYRPVTADKVSEDIINRRYGKYRRT